MSFLVNIVNFIVKEFYDKNKMLSTCAFIHPKSFLFKHTLNDYNVNCNCKIFINVFVIIIDFAMLYT